METLKKVWNMFKDNKDSKIPEQHHWLRSSVFIDNFIHSHAISIASFEQENVFFACCKFFLLHECLKTINIGQL